VQLLYCRSTSLTIKRLNKKDLHSKLRPPITHKGIKPHVTQRPSNALTAQLLQAYVHGYSY